MVIKKTWLVDFQFLYVRDSILLYSKDFKSLLERWKSLIAKGLAGQEANLAGECHLYDCVSWFVKSFRQRQKDARIFVLLSLFHGLAPPGYHDVSPRSLH